MSIRVVEILQEDENNWILENNGRVAFRGAEFQEVAQMKKRGCRVVELEAQSGDWGVQRQWNKMLK